MFVSSNVILSVVDLFLSVCQSENANSLWAYKQAIQEIWYQWKLPRPSIWTEADDWQISYKTKFMLDDLRFSLNAIPENEAENVGYRSKV